MKKNTFLIVLACWMQCLGLFATELENLKVEYATCPMGIDVSTPRFSWQMKAGENEYGIRQNAYQIWVYDEQGTCVWDSKKIADDRSLNIEYAGTPLLPETRAGGAWMYNCSLGIQPDTDNPGFKHFFLKPEPDPTGEMKYARGHYDSMYGRIESGWEILPQSVKYTFTIPANTSATVCLPASGFKNIRMNRSTLQEGKDFQSENGFIRMELESGTYEIEIN